MLQLARLDTFGCSLFMSRLAGGERGGRSLDTFGGSLADAMWKRTAILLLMWSHGGLPVIICGIRQFFSSCNPAHQPLRPRHASPVRTKPAVESESACPRLGKARQEVGKGDFGASVGGGRDGEGGWGGGGMACVLNCAGPIDLSFTPLA
jgi:hypothetical protein